ncbi:MAG: DNA/RNA non-specific endonuclease [Chitinophagales bacterium]
MKKLIQLFLIPFIIGIAACEDEVSIEDIDTCPAYPAGVHLTLGNPSDANLSDNDNFLYVFDSYALSYNCSKGTPNWVSWHLDSRWTGEIPRQNSFLTYDLYPNGCNVITTKDYTGSGFDRGHNCPSADRTCSVVKNDETFLMLNIIPQAPDVNRGLWAEIEKFTRELTNGGNEVYVIMGIHDEGGTGDNGYRKFWAEGQLTIPRYLWRVMIVLPEGNGDTKRLGEDTRVIAVWVENKNSANQKPWHEYITTIYEIEAATGYDLLSDVSDGRQAILQSKRDEGPF